MHRAASWMRHECTAGALCQVREASHRRPPSAGLRLRDIPRVGKPTATGSRLVSPGAGAWGEWGVTTNGVPFGGDGSVLEQIEVVIECTRCPTLGALQWLLLCCTNFALNIHIFI